MQTGIEHTVYFQLDEGEGPVLKTRDGRYARLDAVTVHLRERGSDVWAGATRCRKDGQPDGRMGRVSVSVDVPDPEHWIRRAEEGNEVAVRNDWWSFPVDEGAEITDVASTD